ncbi:MAG: FecR domain-containing protein [Proteobacteria bacterium]|nr:FecR domain-containing protein [Pseudomonadota bacterium]
MTTPEEHVRELITQQAADWFVANRGGLSASEQADFTAWIQASPVNVEEYLAVSVIARDLREACAEIPAGVSEGPEVPLAPMRPPAPVRARPAWGMRAAAALALTVLAAAGLYFLRPARVPAPVVAAAWTAEYATGHGRLRRVDLPDGSVVTLNTDSHLRARFTGQERSLTLTAGEADFRVVHEKARDFRVAAGALTVRAVGTEFTVRAAPSATTVLVLEGRVGVTPRDKDGAEVGVGAGEAVTATDDRWPPTVQLADPERSSAWLRHQIAFEHQPLEQVADEFNRYSAKPILIVTPALRRLEISGVFATDDPAAFIAFLRSLDGVHVEETATQIKVSQAASRAP